MIYFSLCEIWQFVSFKESVNFTFLSNWWDIPGDANGKESACQSRRHKISGFDAWVGKIPWRRAWQSTSVFLPGESHGQRSQISGHGVFNWGQGLITPWGENLIQSLSGRMLCFAFFCFFNPQVDSSGFQGLRTTNAQEWSTSLINCQRWIIWPYIFSEGCTLLKQIILLVYRSAQYRQITIYNYFHL